MHPAVSFAEIPIRSSYLILFTLAALAAAVGGLYALGAIGWLVAMLGGAVRAGVGGGFRLWERHFAWASWPVFLGLEMACLVVGVALAGLAPTAAAGLGLAPLVMGVVACLAYMFIDLERYEVERGYKTVHDPHKGQELAANLVRYDEQVRAPLLGAAAVGVIGGFALLNRGLADGVGAGWFKLDEGGATFTDFLAYAIINLYSVVDLLDLANSQHLLNVAHVKPAYWPASTLLAVFKLFFTLVLLQQFFASIRKGQVLAETITDFWSPHEPIHLRARSALPQYGPVAAGPLLFSLRAVASLTKEQRDQIPHVLALIGPATIPVLTAHLSDPHGHVRAVAVSALGLLHAADTLPALAALRVDVSDSVRLSLAEALGVVGGTEYRVARKRRWLRRGGPSPGRGLGRLFRRRRVAQPAPPPDPAELTLATLRILLTDRVTAVRAAAAVSLGQLRAAGAPATPDLIAHLADADETVRCRAAEALGSAAGADPAALTALVALLEDPSLEVRAAAAQALGKLQGDTTMAVPALVPLLQDTDEVVRQAAAEAIGQAGPLSAAAAEALTEGLTDADNVVRAQTAEALGVIGAAAGGTAPSLAGLLDDSNDRVRALAAEALGKMGAAAAVAVPGLVRALRDGDNWVSALAAEALGEMGDSAGGAVPALVRTLGHANPNVRGQAAEALGKLGPAACGAVPALVLAAADEDGGVRALAVGALGEVAAPTPEATRVLRTGLADADPRVRSAAVEALARAGTATADLAADILRLLEDSNDQVKARAVHALPRLAAATPEVVAALTGRLLTDDSVWVQASAARALGQFGAAASAAGPALVRAAQTSEVGVRAAAMRALALVQPPEAPEAFASGLIDADADIRKVASAGWRKATVVPDEVIPALVEALRDPEDQVRANAAHALGRLADLPAEAVPALVECTTNPDDGLRLSAVLALRSAPAGTVAAVMLHLLDDPSLRVRLVAAGALLCGEETGPKALTIFVEALTSQTAAVHQAALGLFEAQSERAKYLLESLRQRADIDLPPATWAELDAAVTRLAVADQESSRSPTD